MGSLGSIPSRDIRDLSLQDSIESGLGTPQRSVQRVLWVLNSTETKSTEIESHLSVSFSDQVKNA
jgi:hypothetical protein